jgi:hypothetical protein
VIINRGGDFLLTDLNLFLERVVASIRLLVKVVRGSIQISVLLELCLLFFNLLVARKDLPGVTSAFHAPRDACRLRVALHRASFDKLCFLV